MTDLIARCRNTTAPCAFEVVCSSDQHRERVEQTHMERRHTADAAPDSVADDMWTRHVDERAIILKAIEATALVNKGQVDINVVRQLIPDTVTPQLIGAVVNVLLRQRRLERIGWTTNLDRRGRNQGKPLPLYALVGDSDSDEMSLPTSPGEGQQSGPAAQPNSAAAANAPGNAGSTTAAGPDPALTTTSGGTG